MSEVDLSQHQILLVDDVMFVRATVKKILSSFNQPVVIEAVNGEDALKIINSKDSFITMIIADFNMPELNGLELLKKIRCGETQVARDFPIAMLTGYSDEHLVDMALSLDVNAFLIKPISRDALGARLEKMIEMIPETSWVKKSSVYTDIDIVTAADADNFFRVEEAPIPIPPLKPNLVAANKPGSRLSGKFSDEELAPASSARMAPSLQGKFADPDIATRDVMGRLSSLVDRMADPGPAKEVALGFQRLVAGGDRDVARSFVTALDTFEKRGVISTEDIGRVFTGQPMRAASRALVSPHMLPPSAASPAETFTKLDDVPAGAVLARPLHTEDGSVLLRDGIVLTPQILDVLKKLDELDLLLLEALVDSDAESGGIFVHVPHEKQLSSANVRAMRLSQVPANTILGRDVNLSDGRLYMMAGTLLSPRLLSLLQDLVELERFNGELWIAD